jgi:hypothetical protein
MPIDGCERVAALSEIRAGVPKPKAIELLTQRPAWSHLLLDAIAQAATYPPNGAERESGDAAVGEQR